MLKLIAGLVFLLVLVVLWECRANRCLCHYTYQPRTVLSAEEEAQLDREIEEFGEYYRCEVKLGSLSAWRFPSVKVGDVGKWESR